MHPHRPSWPLGFYSSVFIKALHSHRLVQKQIKVAQGTLGLCPQSEATLGLCPQKPRGLNSPLSGITVPCRMVMKGLLEIKDTHRPEGGPMLLGTDLP